MLETQNQSKAEGATVAGSSTSLTKGRFFHDCEALYLQVEDVVHKIPKERLERFSGFFRGMFTLPQGDGHLVEGTSEENPIQLFGCRNMAFESVMEIIYPSAIPYVELSKSQLMAALELSDRWEMEGVQKACLSKLKDRPDLKPIDKVVIGNRYNSPEMMNEGCIHFVKARSDPSDGDIKKMGWAAYGRIARARLAIYNRHGENEIRTQGISCAQCPNAAGKVSVSTECDERKHRKFIRAPISSCVAKLPDTLEATVLDEEIRSILNDQG